MRDRATTNPLHPNLLVRKAAKYGLEALLMDNALGRDERPGVFIVVGDESVDAVDQFLDAPELASPGE